MRRYFLLIIPFILFLSGCFFYTDLEGSGRLISNSYHIGGFYGVKVRDGSQVNITYSNSFSVSALIDDNLLSYVHIHSDGYFLYIEMAPGYSYGSMTFIVNITMPDINALYSRESSNVQISGFSLSDNFNLTLSEASDADIYLTDATHVTASVEEASYLNIDSVYAVEYLDISCREGAAADLKDMECAYGEIIVSDGSSLKVNMIGTLIGQVTGASLLYYRGTSSPGPILFSGGSAIIYY